MASARVQRWIGLVAALAVVGLVTPHVGAQPPGTPPAPGLIVAPGSGTEATPITMGLTAPDDACPGDTTTNGITWSTFFVSASVDVATLTYDASGPIAPVGAPVGTVVQSLRSIGGVPQVALPTVDVTGVIAPIADMNLVTNSGASGVTDGVYELGLACVSTAGETLRHWRAEVTVSGVTATTLAWTLGVVPAAPVLSGALTPGDGSLAGTFTGVTAVPPVSGYTITAAPQGGGAPVTLNVLTPGSFAVSGLTNGTIYDVSVTATNAIGTGLASNTASGTPSIQPRPPVSGLTASPGTETIVLTWTAPTGPAPTGYSIDVSPAVPGSPFTAAAASTSFLLSGLVGGTVYDITVTPLHPAPFVATPLSTGPVAPFAPLIGTGGIQVLRPAGALVLTQRCGVYGALPEEPPTGGLAGLPALPASADQVGTAPLTPGGLPDSVFPEYPYPAVPTYPTRCALDMGTARLLTAGPFAGTYFSASGRLNQITVVDTRDLDPGFTVNGAVTDFTSGGETFRGAYLGWTPVVTSDSGVSFDGYDQLVVGGQVVTPGQGTGLSTPRALAAAPLGRGLGIATLDARLRLLVPVTADAGTYNATLTITII